jgi:hypothetical protein
MYSAESEGEKITLGVFVFLPEILWQLLLFFSGNHEG